MILLVAEALACGALFIAPTGGGQAAVTADLRGIYFVGDAATTMLVQVSWQGDASAFTLLVPIPAPVTEDQVAVVESSAINEMLDYTDPSFTGSYGCGLPLGMYGCAGDAAFADTSAIDVLGTYAAGPYEVKLLDVDEAGDVTGWLQDQGYEVSADAEPILDDYAAQGFYFLAVQLREVPASSKPTALPAIAVTYDSTEVVYPLRMSAASTADELEVVLLTAGRHRMQPQGEPWVAPDLGGGQPIGDEVNKWYNGRLRVAIEAEAQRAWGIEYAGPVDGSMSLFTSLAEVGLMPPAEHDDGQFFVTRYRSWLRPELLDADLSMVPAGEDETYSVAGAVYSALPGLLLFGALWRRRAR